MSERMTDEKLNELIGLFEAMDDGGAPPLLLGVLVGETYVALTELLALRAEINYLRAVEQAARALKQWASTQPICPACKAEVTFTGWYGHHPHCRLRQLHYALSATKQEPEKP